MTARGLAAPEEWTAPGAVEFAEVEALVATVGVGTADPVPVMWPARELASDRTLPTMDDLAASTAEEAALRADETALWLGC